MGAGTRRRWPRTCSGSPAGVALLALCMAADIVLTDDSAAIVGAFVAAPFVTALLAGPLTTAIVGAPGARRGDREPAMEHGFRRHRARRPARRDRCRRALAVVGAGIRSTVGRRSRAPAAARLGRGGRRRLAAPGRDAAPGHRGDRARRSATSASSTPSTRAACRGSRPGRGVATTRSRSRSSLRAPPPALPGWLVGLSAPGVTSRSGGRASATRSCGGWRTRPKTSSSCARSGPALVARDPDPRPRPQPRRPDPDHRLVGTPYDADDVRFAQILASRIGLALDNAGLFSDLESIERRMDTVMSILDEAIVIHGADGELVFANPAAARMLGFETRRGRGRGADRLDPPTASRSATRRATRSRRASSPGAGLLRRRARRAADAARDRARDRDGALDADQGSGDRRARPARSSTR